MDNNVVDFDDFRERKIDEWLKKECWPRKALCANAQGDETWWGSDMEHPDEGYTHDYYGGD